MKTKFSGFLTLTLALIVQITFAQEKTITGTVSDESGPLPGVSILIKGTTTGTETDFDGKYSIQASIGDVLVYSFVGMSTQERAVGSNNVINVVLEADNVLEEVVVTALGMQREAKTLPYAAQEIKAEDLNITQDANIKTAIAGKVSGVQVQGQAGSKLGQAGKIRIRGAISLTSDNDPLYVVDGVPTDPNNIDMDNVASLNVLKGPNATALYGQRADAGVVVITTKKGSQGGIGVEILSSITFEKVAYLPEYQNLYGQGYEGDASFGTFGDELPLDWYPSEWSGFVGQRYILWDNNYADESWGPRFDGQDYLPWYAWWPGTADNPNPYFGQTAKWEAQPNNIKDYYDTGVTIKNTVALSGGSEKFRGRLSFTDLDQTGISPYTKLDKQFLSTSFDYDITDKFNASVSLNYTTSKVQGDFNDGYGNQGAGSFNSWWARNVEIDKLRELKDLTTLNGYSASWNNWGPDYFAYLGGGFEKPAFWFNPYFYFDHYENIDRTQNYVGNINLSYELNDNWSIKAGASKNYNEYKNDYKVPYAISFSAAPELYNAWQNSFGVYRRTQSEDNLNASLNYQNEFGDFDLDAFVGGNIRFDKYDRFSAQMPTGGTTGGLIIPDVYSFSNASIIPTPSTYFSKKEVRSVYGKASIGYKNFVYLDATYRKDWSSALPSDNNGYGYPSVGASFIFSELMGDKSILSFGKLRAGWAQVGNDLAAYLLDPSYPLSAKPFQGISMQYAFSDLVDFGIKPALNTSYEFGFDTKFINNRLGLSVTYYKENRENEIIPISISNTTGYSRFLTNAGESERKGIELTFTATPFKSDDFSWDLTFNWATNETKVISLPAGLQALNAPGGAGAFGFASMVHQLGNNWGQIRGTAITRDSSGNPIINANGTYATTQGEFLGSVLPDFTGGLLNQFSYKGLTLTASIDFQKGGKFFSLSEQWGQYSGLLKETAAINDRGFNVRDDVDAGGGVHVTGVNSSGSPVDMYVDAVTYYNQFYGNRLAEPFIHDASFIKLRDISLTYSLPKKLIENVFSSASVSLVGRNLWIISLADDNIHNWDPSELSQTYGENGQLPGTKSYGLNVKLTF